MHNVGITHRLHLDVQVKCRSSRTDTAKRFRDAGKAIMVGTRVCMARSIVRDNWILQTKVESGARERVTDKDLTYFYNMLTKMEAQADESRCAMCTSVKSLYCYFVSSKRHAFYAVMNELMGRPLQAPAYTFTQQLARFWWPSAQVGEASAEKKRKRPEGTIDDVAHSSTVATDANAESAET